MKKMIAIITLLLVISAIAAFAEEKKGVEGCPYVKDGVIHFHEVWVKGIENLLDETGIFLAYGENPVPVGNKWFSDPFAIAAKNNFRLTPPKSGGNEWTIPVPADIPKEMNELEVQLVKIKTGVFGDDIYWSKMEKLQYNPKLSPCITIYKHKDGSTRAAIKIKLK
ncbi:hypothetical protein HY798_00220 [Candidatus Falkowbacteria bacterium]|nr:hypothetical protein [Candidatus Falkowbacteria bacterium]